MGMNKQIKLYSINLGMAKTERERQLYRMKYLNDGSLYRYKNTISTIIKDSLGVDDWTEECSMYFKEMIHNDKTYRVINERNKDLTKMIREEVDCDWIITYDDVPEIADIYKDYN